MAAGAIRHAGLYGNADFDGQGNVTYRYLYGPAVDRIMARLGVQGDIAWYLGDHLGTVRDLADPSGQVIDHIAYDSFGGILAETNPTAGDRFKFTAREFDAAIEEYSYRARYYDARIGRFTSEDLLGFAAGDANVFRYVLNRPTVATDPTGRYVWEVVEALWGEVVKELYNLATEHAVKEPTARLKVAILEGIGPSLAEGRTAGRWKDESGNIAGAAGYDQSAWQRTIWKIQRKSNAQFVFEPKGYAVLEWGIVTVPDPSDPRRITGCLKWRILVVNSVIMRDRATGTVVRSTIQVVDTMAGTIYDDALKRVAGPASGGPCEGGGPRGPAVPPYPPIPPHPLPPRLLGPPRYRPPPTMVPPGGIPHRGSFPTSPPTYRPPTWLGPSGGSPQALANPPAFPGSGGGYY